MVAALRTKSESTLGLYLSVPFCRSKCTYCNFASGVYPASEHGRYVERLIAELRHAQSWAASLRAELPERVDSVYFGGGTPVLLGPQLLTAIFTAIREEFTLDAQAEITMECAPGQLTDETLEALVAAGVNRVSMGVQSFVDREAAVSGRLHTRAIVLDDIARLRKAGIGNLNLDLLAGLAGQNFNSWAESLNVLVETGVPHASVYMLEIDEESRLGRELLDGGARYHADLVPSDDSIATMYERALDALAAASYGQYEISNFAQSGFASRHNLRYWNREPYLGVGLDAASMLRSSDTGDDSVLRATTTDDLKEYLHEDFPASTRHCETAWLGAAQQLEEAWFLGLRRNSGVSVEALRQEFGEAAIAASLEAAHRLVADDMLILDSRSGEEHFSLTNHGRLLSNDVFAQFLGLRSVPANREAYSEHQRGLSD